MRGSVRESGVWCESVCAWCEGEGVSVCKRGSKSE